MQDSLLEPDRIMAEMAGAARRSGPWGRLINGTAVLLLAGIALVFGRSVRSPWIFCYALAVALSLLWSAKFAFPRTAFYPVVRWTPFRYPLAFPIRTAARSI